MKIKLLLLLIFLLPMARAYTIDITLNDKDIVKEDFLIDSNATAGYDHYEYQTINKPLSVIYDGDYTINKVNDQYSIIFKYNNKDKLTFSIIYNNILGKSGNKRMLRSSFENADSISVTLPEGYVLSDEPSTIPKPDDITSDGQHIKLSWNDTDSIAVFYQGKRSYALFIVLGFILLAVAVIFYFMSRKRVSKAIREVLSDDENLVINEIKKGVVKQKAIAANLNFSKSKMSKVMRKLEEKGLVEKIPHFKTNIIKLKKI